MSSRRRNKSGSILMDVLLSFMIVCFFMPLGFTVLSNFSKMERFPYEVQDQIALAQLRRFLNGCRIIFVNEQKLICENDREWTLQVSTSNLYLSEGTIIVLQQIDGVYFEVVSRMVWLHYERKGIWKEALIGKV